jgi:hypothetical protein
MSKQIIGVDQGGQYVWSRDYEELYKKAKERIKELEIELETKNEELKKEENDRTKRIKVRKTLPDQSYKVCSSYPRVRLSVRCWLHYTSVFHCSRRLAGCRRSSWNL